MRLVTIMLALLFCGMLLEVQPISAGPGKQAAPPTAAKETKWQGTIVHIMKDQSMMEIRGGVTTSDSDMHKIAFDSSTQWTKQGKPADQGDFKEGQFVIVLGTVDSKGVLRASRIDLRLPR
ncbi:MAG: DUF5666 domain-containing protein [Candidatus Acidiferrum sp.]